MRHTQIAVVAVLVAALGAAGCSKKKPPVARPMPPPAGTGTTAAPPPAPPTPVPDTTPIPPEPKITDDLLVSGDLDAINKNSPFQPVFFALDSFEIAGAAQQALIANGEILKKCALAARTYLVSLGVPADRLRTVSYGKEFPFDPGHDEGAWFKNRRAHFVVTSK